MSERQQRDMDFRITALVDARNICKRIAADLKGGGAATMARAVERCARAIGREITATKRLRAEIPGDAP